MLQVDIITLFPEMFPAVLKESILKRAHDKSLFQLRVIDLRKFASGKHSQADDRPFGGGAGMVLMPGPIFKAVESLRQENTKVILTCARGDQFDQEKAQHLAQESHLIIICGHYEGVDERVRQHLVDETYSIGDFILTGGELPAMVMVDSMVRLIAGVLGNSQSLSQGAYPQYTRPADYNGLKVPDILLSGNHSQIDEWRRKEDRQ